MKTILDMTFTEYFRHEWTGEYYEMKNKAEECHLNDIIKGKGYLTLEKLSEVLNFYVSPDEIDNTKVLRYEPGKILRVNRKQVGTIDGPEIDMDIYKISFTYEEEKANENH